VRATRNAAGVLALACCFATAFAQSKPFVSKVWVSDNGDGTYANPVLFSDYSDPDAIRVGDKFYLVSSSFDQVPGLPILESPDLVNWKLIGHALVRQPPVDVYRATGHGNGVWAPSLRFHAGEFYLYYPDPEFGIYVVKAKTITGPWSTPKLIRAAKGWIDPCPFWDADGKAYLINGMAASRSGVKNVLVLSRMAADGESLLDDGALIVDGHGPDETLEGPKFYKRNGYYYIFAPAGGVPTGYEVIFRSKTIYGPYERKVVLAQGTTEFNGPHQGAWVQTAAGADWFLHFQDRGAYGRVVLLEPMHWADDWPVMGIDQNAAGVGEPVARYRKPVAGAAVETPADSDEFDGPALGLQWQWQANPQLGWVFPSAALGILRMENVPIDATLGERLWTTPNVLLQKVPGPAFTVTTSLRPVNLHEGDRSGLVLMGRSYAYVAVRSTAAGPVLVYGTAKDADKGGAEVEAEVGPVAAKAIQLRITMAGKAQAQFSYSADGVSFSDVGATFAARDGVWVGAKVGLFAQSKLAKGERGYTDVDWFRFTK
jgi:beta-xylosidase